MAAGSAYNTEYPTCRVDERNERFAALVRADRSAILTSYVQCLESVRSPVISDPCFRGQLIAEASEVISDVAESVAAADVRIGGHRTPASRPIRPKPERCQRPVDTLHAAALLFKVVMASLALHIRDDHDLLSCYTTAILALNQSINTRVQEYTVVYTGHLLDRVHRAHIEERRRIARELHDRLGEGISSGLRQLDLREISGSDDQVDRGALAREALTGTMRELRQVTSDLRQEPETSMEKALIRYLDSAAADAHVRLRVCGDEAWVPPAIIDEVFLIVREAIRNALTHAAPQLVLIGIDLSPHELRAWVEDDGCGFPAAEGLDTAVDGNGLVSMRERAALIGGRFTLSSAPGAGTRVELVAPLPGRRHEQP